MSDSLPLLWLCGPSGVGKSSVGWELFRQLNEEGVKAAFLDGDQIGMIYPVPEGATHRIRAGNLAAIWKGLRDEGTQFVVLSGFLNNAEDIREYTERIPDAALTVCRLRVEHGELKRRFIARGWRPDLVAEAITEAEDLDRTDFADLRLETDEMTVPEVATLLRQQTSEPVAAAPVAAAPVAAAPVAAAPVAAAPIAAAAPGPAAPGPATPGPLAPDADALPVLWFSGATAVGKSTIAYGVFSELLRSGTPAAYADLKQLAALRPSSDAVKARNLAAVWAGYRAEGAQCLVVSGEASLDDTVRQYAELLPRTKVTVFRLHANPTTLAERVALRGRGGGPTIPGDEIKGLDTEGLRRVTKTAVTEADTLDRANAGDHRINTDTRHLKDIVTDIQSRL